MKIKIGNVYEVKTSKGLSCFQYTHEYTKPPKWGSLVRVLDGFYKQRPPEREIANIVKNPHRFQIFLLLRRAISNKEVTGMGNFPIPDFAQKFPVFKNTNTPPKGNQLEAKWSLWDGEKSWKVGTLSEEKQMKYPFHSLCDITALIGLIETGAFFNRKVC